MTDEETAVAQAVLARVIVSLGVLPPCVEAYVLGGVTGYAKFFCSGESSRATPEALEVFEDALASGCSASDKLEAMKKAPPRR